LFLFGAPRLQRGDEPIQVDTRKAIALLAYLAVTGERHSRDALATLWSNCDQTRARGMLRRTLSILNSVLSHECPAIDRETIGLDLQSPLWVAATNFRATLTQRIICVTSIARAVKQRFSMILSKLSDRIHALQWTVPFAIGILFVLYEFGPGRWIHDVYGASNYFGADLLLFAVIIPLVSFLLLRRWGDWLKLKENQDQRTLSAEHRFAAITATSADAILSLDASGQIESWNRGAELLLGFASEEIRGQRFDTLLGGGDAARVELDWLSEMVRLRGFVRGHETTCRDAENRLVDVDVTATRLDDAAGHYAGMSVILREATERKRRDQEIQRLTTNLNQQIAHRTRELAEKVEELGRANAELKKLDQMRDEFVSLVAHQLRAPLTNMNGAVESIVANGGALNETCRQMLTILNQQIDRLDRLVRDVLNTAAIESGGLTLHPEPISLAPILQQTVEQIRTRRTRRAFQLAIKPGMPLIFADRDRVAEVLANLYDNADKYSAPDQNIVVETRADETEVTISVRDFGKGIPPADLDRIFDKFYRTDSSDAQAAYGYGLGLYVCRQLVQAQGGRIWAENHPDGGAVLSFTLPVAR